MPILFYLNVLETEKMLQFWDKRFSMRHVIAAQEVNSSQARTLTDYHLIFLPLFLLSKNFLELPYLSKFLLYCAISLQDFSMRIKIYFKGIHE